MVFFNKLQSLICNLSSKKEEKFFRRNLQKFHNCF
nr:MAG TPA: hypothetical protein [Herelleviridae sp.]